MSDRLTRKEIKHDIRHDRFRDEVEGAYGTMARNRNKILAGIGGLIVLVLIITGVVAWQRHQEAQAQDLLALAIEASERPLAGSDEAAPDALRTEEERTALAEPMFRRVVDEYGRTDAADVARLFLANYAVARDDLAAARPLLEAFISSQGTHLLAGVARVSLYQIRITAGEGAEVIEELERYAGSDRAPLPHDVLLATLASAYEQAGDQTRARDVYQRLINEFPDSPYTMEAQRRLFRT
jgi:predicted negative regulator of RcsB-dependent stress response